MPSGVYIRTQKHRDILSQAQKRIGNKPPSPWRNKYNTGRKPSKETKDKMSKTHLKIDKPRVRKPKGNKAHNWKGGITPLRNKIWESVPYREWRQSILQRNNFTCQECGKRGGNLEVHHIKTFKSLLSEALEFSPLLSPYDAVLIYTPFWELDNGITLCVPCHNKTKRNNRYKN